jgi:hypothetical protein
MRHKSIVSFSPFQGSSPVFVSDGWLAKEPTVDRQKSRRSIPTAAKLEPWRGGAQYRDGAGRDVKWWIGLAAPATVREGTGSSGWQRRGLGIFVWTPSGANVFRRARVVLGSWAVFDKMAQFPAQYIRDPIDVLQNDHTYHDISLSKKAISCYYLSSIC